MDADAADARSDSSQDVRRQRNLLKYRTWWETVAACMLHPQYVKRRCLGRLKMVENRDFLGTNGTVGGLSEDSWEWQTYGEVLDNVRALAVSLVREGIVPDLSSKVHLQAEEGVSEFDDCLVSEFGDTCSSAPSEEATGPSEEATGPDATARAFVAICGPNSPSWALADLALTRQAAVSVPLSVPGKGASAADLAYVLRHADVTAVFCGVAEVPALAEAIFSLENGVKYVILFDDETRDHLSVERAVVAFEHSAVQVFLMSKLVAEGRDSFVPAIKRVPSAIHTIMYTSGSTGDPKGAMLTEQRWKRFMTTPWMMPDPLWHFSYAPLAHVMERQQLSIALTYGGHVGFASGDASLLFDELQAFCPSFFSAAPRIWNEIYAQFKYAVAEKVRAARTAKIEDPYVSWEEYFTSERTRYYYNKLNGRSQWDRPSEIVQFEEQIMSRFSGLIGTRVQYIVTGGAAISDTVLAFLRECFQCPVFDGFGTTETGGITNDSTILPEVDAILEDVPDLGYTNADLPFPRGEICVKTPFLISGYYKDSSTTSASFTPGGYFRTGDIGMRIEQDKIIIVDRRKQVFKLAQGEFVAPERLEHLFISADLVDQIFVYGDHSQSFLVAVVSPNLAAARSAITRRRGRLGNSVESLLPSDDEAFIFEFQDDLCAEIFCELQRIGQSARLQQFEVPRNFFVVAEKWMPENGLMTASWKLKRRAVEARYRTQIDRLYADVEQARARIQRAVAEGFSADMSVSVPLVDQGIDSMAAVRLGERLRIDFDTEIPLEVLSKEGLSVEQLADFVWEQRFAKGAEDAPEHSHSATNMQAVNLAIKDAAIAFAPSQFSTESRQVPAAKVVVLLTGCTGFLGRWVLDELLRTTDADVYCLVRAPNSADPQEAAHARLEKVIRSLDMNTTTSAAATARAFALAGDLALPQFGFSDATWKQLCTDVSVVIHCGAVVNWLASYESLRPANVTGALTILSFCTTGRLKPLHYVSSIGVAGHFESQLVAREFLRLLNPYSLTKYAAESIIARAANEHNLPISISRPGMISGHSKTGVSNGGDFVNRYIRGMLELNAVPEFACDLDTSKITQDRVLDMTPVDFVSAAIVKLTMESLVDATILGKVYHLLNPIPMPYVTLHRAICEAQTDCTTLPYDIWRERLCSSVTNPIFALLPYFPESGFVMFTPPYNRENADTILAKFKIFCPPCDATLAQLYIAADLPGSEDCMERL